MCFLMYSRPRAILRPWVEMSKYSLLSAKPWPAGMNGIKYVLLSENIHNRALLPTQVIVQMCWGLLGGYDPFVIGEYVMVESVFPQSRGRLL